MDDDPEKDEEAKSQSQPIVRSDVSEEALVEREHRSIVYTSPVGVSKGTDTTDDPLPPRKKKKKIPPAVPAKKHAGETDSQTDAASAESAESTVSAPRSQPSSLLRSASSEFPSSSTQSSHTEHKTQRSRSLDRESYSSEEEMRRELASRSKIFRTRHIDYDTAEVLKEGKVDSQEQQESEYHPGGSTSFHWRLSASSLNVQDDGCVAGSFSR
ncbi:uncharacterized protein [Drosophila takahashii]|uniref:uncharacterized protein isoform X2 n=1 Tax=Drosophila takahashii TaxID=29030 RepID=UPI0038990A72